MDVDKRELALELLPSHWRRDAVAAAWPRAEEIRLRAGRRPTLLIEGSEQCFREERVQREDLQKILEKATGASLHAASQSLSEGYVSYRGLRIGVCGSAVVREGRLCGFYSLSSLAVRIPGECKGLCPEITERWLRCGFESTLICAPPGAGKTTLLRELIRALSEGGIRIGVADERNELASFDRDGSGFDLGPCSDVVTGIKRGNAAMMLLRGMNVQILAMDEITEKQDKLILDELCGCGVGLLASVHGRDRKDLLQRPDMKTMLERGLFSKLLRIEERQGRRSYTLESLPL